MSEVNRSINRLFAPIAVLAAQLRLWNVIPHRMQSETTHRSLQAPRARMTRRRFTWTQQGADYFYLQGFGKANYINKPDWESKLLVTQDEGWEFVASPVLGVAERAYWIAGNNLATFPEYADVVTGSMDPGSQLVMELWNASNKLQMWQFHLIID
ncbi:hypothetical protein AURDEDRAFT_125927 [Auricularia subglabra TFB-10046 SS5]|nr:hypothetical protein AURDEDRAFT_125927 [Auricularia subglabra TFB-10046 SS5]